MPAKDYTRVTVYLKPQDKKQIEAKAKERGLAISSYFLWLAEQDIGYQSKRAYNTFQVKQTNDS